MTASDVHMGPVMVTDPAQLPPVMQTMATQFPDVHHQLVAALGRAMRSDGVMEFTVTGVAKDAEVRLNAARLYLKAARQDGLLHVLGRRTDNGKIRYCAYETRDHPTVAP